MIADCWNRVGVRGDASCPELAVQVHCRNCRVFSAAASELLDVEIPPDYARYWTGLVALERSLAAPVTKSVLIFRIGEERFAFATAIFREIAGMRPIRSLPHGHDDAVLGLVNIGGELLICASLRRVLGLAAAPEAREGRREKVTQRLLVLAHEGRSFVLPVDEIYGIERYRVDELRPVPATLERSACTFTMGVMPWSGFTVGLLDDGLLFAALERRLTSIPT